MVELREPAELREGPPHLFFHVILCMCLRGSDGWVRVFGVSSWLCGGLVNESVEGVGRGVGGHSGTVVGTVHVCIYTHPVILRALEVPEAPGDCHRDNQDGGEEDVNAGHDQHLVLFVGGGGKARGLGM